MVTPNIPTPINQADTVQIEMSGLVYITSGITRSETFDSPYRNSASISADSASSDSTRTDDQPYCVAQVSASSSGTTVPTSVANPAQSSRREAPRGFRCGNLKYM